MSLSEVVVDPNEVVRVAPPNRLEDLEPGLLMFFARPSPLQSWAELFGHEWRHVGVTVQTEEGLRLVGYGPRKCFRVDNPFEIMHTYNRVGVARLFHTNVEVAQVEKFCRGFADLERKDESYTFSSVFFGPLHLTARRRPPGPLRSVLFFIVYLYCMMQELRYRDRPAYACSTFVWDVVNTARAEPLRIPLSANPQDEAAYATVSTARDELYARWLCGPSEMWDAISDASRCELDLEGITEQPHGVIDLRDTSTEVAEADSARTWMAVAAGMSVAQRSVAQLLRSSN